MTRRTKKALLILLLASAHFAASVVTLVVVLGMSFARFEPGPGGTDVYTPPTAAERVLETVLNVLLFPVAPLEDLLPAGWLSGPLRFLELPAFFLNSLLWGVCLYLIATWLWRVWRRRATA